MKKCLEGEFIDNIIELFASKTFENVTFKNNIAPYLWAFYAIKNSHSSINCKLLL